MRTNTWVSPLERTVTVNRNEYLSILLAVIVPSASSAFLMTKAEILKCSDMARTSYVLITRFRIGFACFGFS